MLTVVIEHHTVAEGKEQRTTLVVQLQINIVVIDVVGTLFVEGKALLVVLVDAIVLDIVSCFDTSHHLQSRDDGDLGVELKEPDGLVVAVADDTMLVVADGKLFKRIVFACIGKQGEQFGADVVEGVKPSAAEKEHLFALILAKVLRGGVGVLVTLDGIGAQQVSACQTTHHFGVEVLLVLVDALDIGSVELCIGEEVCLGTAVTDIGSAVELVVRGILQRGEAVSTSLILAQIDVDDTTFACAAFGDTRVVADLYLLDVLGHNLCHYQTAVGRDGHIVETQLVTAQQVVVTAYQQVGNELEDVHQCFIAVQVESIGINNRAVTEHLDGRLLLSR